MRFRPRGSFSKSMKGNRSLSEWIHIILFYILMSLLSHHEVIGPLLHIQIQHSECSIFGWSVRY